MQVHGLKNGDFFSSLSHITMKNNFEGEKKVLLSLRTTIYV